MSQEEPKSGDNLVSEFKERFGSHPIRIERFKITQGSKIMETRNNLIQELQGAISLNIADLIALLYEFLLSEDLYEEPIIVFLEDFKLICNNFGYNYDISPNEELIEKVVTPYIQTLKFQTDVYFDLSRWLIQRLGQGWDLQLARSYTLNDFLKPLMKTIIEQFPDVDIKFLSAMAWTTLERYITRGSGNQVRLGEKFVYLMSEYPIHVTGSKFAYDLAFMYLFRPNWDNLLKMIDKEIEQLKETIKAERERMLKEQQATKAAAKAAAQTDPVDDAKNKVSLKLNELFGFGYEWNENRESQIFKAMNLLLRRVSLKVYGHVAAESVEPIKKELELFLWPEVIEYPRIIAFGLNVKSKFYDPNWVEPQDLLEEIEENPEKILEYKDKFFEKLLNGYRGGADYDTISSNLCKLLKAGKEHLHHQLHR